MDSNIPAGDGKYVTLSVTRVMGLVEKRHQETQCLLPQQKYSYYVRNGLFHTVGSSFCLVKVNTDLFHI